MFGLYRILPGSFPLEVYLVSHFLTFLLNGLFHSSFQVPHHKDLSWGNTNPRISSVYDFTFQQGILKIFKNRKSKSTFPTAWYYICKSMDDTWINDQLVSLIYIKLKTLAIKYMDHYVLLIWISHTLMSELSFNALSIIMYLLLSLSYQSWRKAQELSLYIITQSLSVKPAWEKWSSSPLISCLELRPIEMELLQS